MSQNIDRVNLVVDEILAVTSEGAKIKHLYGLLHRLQELRLQKNYIRAVDIYWVVCNYPSASGIAFYRGNEKIVNFDAHRIDEKEEQTYMKMLLLLVCKISVFEGYVAQHPKKFREINSQIKQNTVA